MSDEETQNVDEVIEKGGKHPETVSWSQYVGIKEKFNRVETEYKGKVGTLEEQLKVAVSTEEHNRIKAELEEASAKLKTTSEELQGIKDKSASEKREILVKRGVPEDKAKGMSEKEMDTVLGVLGTVTTPKPDLGGGGGSGSLVGSPMELAQRAYSK